jgi:hypothetical protein
MYWQNYNGRSPISESPVGGSLIGEIPVSLTLDLVASNNSHGSKQTNLSRSQSMIFGV